jgi:polysaccharide pyruvyl transferase WcaK-like protein
MRVGVAGWFGSDNVGDEVLLATTLGLIRASARSSQMMVFAADAGRVAELHGVRAVPLAPAGYAAKLQALPGVARELRRLDVVVVGPGTVLQERSPNLRWPGTLPLFLRLCLLARAAGTPVVLFGVGVREGTTAPGRAALRLIGRSAAAVGARDRASAALLGPAAEVIGDVAAAWTPPGPAAPVRREDRFAVSLRPLPAGVAGPVVAAVDAAATALAARGLSGEFLVMARGRGAAGEDDLDAWRAHFSAALPPLQVPLARAVRPDDEWIRILGSYRVVVAARLHAALLALHFGTPTVAVAHEEKISRTMAALGLGDFVWRPGMACVDLARMAERALDESGRFLAARAVLARGGAAARQFLGDTLAALAS